MKALALLIALVAFCPLVQASDLPDQIKLTNGFVMRDCEVLRWEKDSVLVKYVGGTVPIKFANMSPDSRKAFESQQKNALIKQHRADELSAAMARSHDSGDSNDNGTEAAAKKDADEQKESAIQHGVTYHELVKGMTQDQVKQAYGYPNSTSDDSGSATWTFAHRSKFVWEYDGTQKDVTLYFTDGRLTGWRNY